MSSGRHESSLLSDKNTAKTDLYEIHSPGVGNEFDSTQKHEKACVYILLHTWQIVFYLQFSLLTILGIRSIPAYFKAQKYL